MVVVNAFAPLELHSSLCRKRTVLLRQHLLLIKMCKIHLSIACKFEYYCYYFSHIYISFLRSSQFTISFDTHTTESAVACNRVTLVSINFVKQMPSYFLFLSSLFFSLSFAMSARFRCCVYAMPASVSGPRACVGGRGAAVCAPRSTTTNEHTHEIHLRIELIALFIQHKTRFSANMEEKRKQQ